MQKLPDFEGLAMFAKVAEQRSFAAAARAMGVSVATVSRGVTRLEERLGARLFNRTSRQLALTDFRLNLVERATRIYCEAEDVENAARNSPANHAASFVSLCPWRSACDGSHRFYRAFSGSIRRWRSTCI
jgi:DNA-binding transcriptional LysR family regulator